ncbi:DUF4118 domain-containing protein [Deltaproteobacteria bacterium TL4]
MIFKFKNYGYSLVLVLLVSLLSYPVRPYVEPTNLVMLYLTAVIVAALRYGLKPAILASCLSVLVFNLIFIPPYYTYVVHDAQYLLTFMGLLLVGIIVSTLAAQSRKQTREAEQRALQMESLYHLSRDLVGASELSRVMEIISVHVEKLYGESGVVWLNRDNMLVSVDDDAEKWLNTDQQAAKLAFDRDCATGAGTSLYPELPAVYLPLRSAKAPVGVLKIPLSTIAINQVQIQFLESIANQGAQAIERLQLAAKAQEAQLLKETDKFQAALLNSISHDLRTPLVTITGSLSSLMEDETHLDEASRKILINTAWQQADRLNRFVSNLLEMTQLEAGSVKVRYEPCDIQDLIGVVLNHLENQIGNRYIKTSIPLETPLIPMDFMLMMQVLINLIDNALKYSPENTAIEMNVKVQETTIELDVIDEGIGIPPEEIPYIFNKFYRIQRPDNATGTGLGLSICKGLVEAHHGKITVCGRPEGGTIMTIILPINDIYGNTTENTGC